jgi:UDP-arabinose 4-epimerase
METVLVTGGAGFIGSHTCKLLSEAGYTPVVYDNLSTGDKSNVKWGPFIRGDIRDGHQLRQTLRRWQPVCVIHFAASAYVGESTQDPSKYYNNNAAGTLVVLDTCLDAKVRKIVFSSSCATYGVAQQLPLTGGTAQVPVNPYGRTKLIGEMMLKDFAAAYGVHYVALRYFNAAGADPSGELRERHDPETHLIPRALMAAAGKLECLNVFGNDYETPDGTCVRDYIHVTDLARAHVLSVDYLLRGGKNLAVNLGSGHGTSVKQVIDAIERLTGRKVPVHYGPRRAGDPPVLFADTEAAADRLGFSPICSDLETIIKTAAPTFGLEVRHDLPA